MEQHPIEGLMKTAMQNIKEMVDVNTIVGDPVQTPDGTVIIPISKVSFGFAAGGGDFKSKEESNNQLGDTQKGNNDTDSSKKNSYPFAGGSGAFININPIAFMIVGLNQIKLLPVTINSSLDRVLDLIPNIFDKVNESMKKKTCVKTDIRPASSSTIRRLEDLDE